MSDKEVSLGTYGDNEVSLGTYGDNWQPIPGQIAEPSKADMARANGYTWDEIDGHIMRASLAASNFGYTQDEIDTYLGYMPKTLDSYQNKWASAFGNDPELFQRYEDDPLSVNVTDNPSWKSDYVEALKSGTAKGVMDFAYDYAADLLNAWTNLSGSPIPIENQRMRDAQNAIAAQSAEAMAADLAHPRDITDAALAIGGQFDKTRQRVMDEWERSNYSLPEIAIKATTNPEYRERLVGSFIPGFEGSFANEIGKGVIRGTADIASNLALLGQYAWDAVRKVDAAFGLEDSGTEFKGYLDSQVKVWADREKKWKEDYAAGNNLRGTIGGTLGSAVPNIAGLVVAGVPAMVAYAAMAGAARAYRDTSSLPAAATGAAIGAVAMGAPVPFLKGAIGRGVIDGAVYGALGMGGMGVLQTYLDPFPKYVAGQGYEFPTGEQVAGAFLGGATLGSLVGAFGAATRPTREVLNFNKDGNPPSEYRPIEEVFKPSDFAVRTTDINIPSKGKTEAIEAWHASPHKFTKFSMKAVDTGEGSQVEGYGLYFAENPEVHTEYRFNLAKTDPGDAYFGPSIEELAHSYRVRLHVDKNLLLDRGLPLSKQTPEVKAAIEKVQRKVFGPPKEGEPLVTSDQKHLGGHWFDGLRREVGDQLASEELKAAGLQGARYFDAGSQLHADIENAKSEISRIDRGLSEYGPEFAKQRRNVLVQEVTNLTRQLKQAYPNFEKPTYNYVIFHDDKIEIHDINGEKIEPTPAEKLEALVQEHTLGGILPRDAVASPEFQAKIAKLEEMRLTREGIIPDEFDRPNFFSNLAKDMDQPTKDLAASYDATAQTSKFFKKLYDDLLNEQGAIAIPETVKRWGENRTANIAGKEIGELIIRKIRNGQGDQNADVIADSMEPFYKLLAPHQNEFLQELIDVKKEGFMYGAPRSMIMKAINDYETGGLGGVDKSNAIYPFMEHYSLLNKVLDTAITKAEQADQIPPTSRIQYYIQHMFKPDKLGKPAGASSGKLGSTGWMRERRIPTTWEALQEGYEMRYPHFIEHVLASINTHYRTLETYKMLDVMRKVDDGAWAYWSTEGPKREGDIALYGLGTKKLAMDPKTGKFAVDANNKNIELQMYAQSGTARTWNNMANWETFVTGQGAGKGWFDNAMRFKNVTTRFKLFFPFFHMITEYKQAENIGVTSAAMYVSKGMFKEGLLDLANVPWMPFKYIYKSKAELEPMYKSLMNDKTMQPLIEGGMSMLHSEVHGDFYEKGRPPTFWTDWKRGELRQRYTPWEKPGADWTDTAKLPLRALSQLAVSLNAPVWHQGIPAIKNAAGYHLMDTYLKTHPNASEAQVATASRQINELIDSRLGMAKSENLFWRPLMKKVTGLTLLSQLWKYGTIQSTMAGLGWRMGHGLEWNSFATYNLAAQLATVAATNAIWSLVLVGKVPDEAYDYIIPFATARAFATMGTRVMIPGEEKEYHDWWRIIAQTYSVGRDTGVWGGASQFLGSTFHYGAGALAPVWQSAIHFIYGEDAIGHDIKRRPDAMASFLKNEYGPIFWNGMEQADLKGVPQWQNILGIRGVSSLEQDFQKYLDQDRARGQRRTADELRRSLREQGVEPNEIRRIMRETRPPRTPRGTPNTSGGTGSFQYVR